ncbi:MAG TPA: hypothetical protein VGM64_15385 [Lacunisphaera sp.]|jgi:hypothetical protein
MKTALILLSVLLTALPSFAAQSDPVGEKAMHDYVLTMSKVKAFGAALEATEAAVKKDPALKAEIDKSSEEPDQTFADLKARFDHHPKLYAFFEKQGLSKDDAILVPLTLMNAGSVAQYPQIAEKMKATVSSQQIAFYKEHQEELQKLKFIQGGGGE